MRETTDGLSSLRFVHNIRSSKLRSEWLAPLISARGIPWSLA